MQCFLLIATIIFKNNMLQNIPTITKNLLIINLLAFLATLVIKGTFHLDLNDVLGLHFFLASDFHLYQLLTYMFMHAGWQHILFNMFSLWMFGCVVEKVWGPKRFLFYYIFCGVGAGLLQEIAQLGQFYWLATEQIPGFHISDLYTVAVNSNMLLNQWTTVGASGAIYAILLAFGMIFPEQRIFIFPIPFPIKGKWFVVLCAGIELFMAMGTSGNVAHMAHLGGMLFGYFLIRYWQKHPSMYYDGMAGGQHFFERMRKNWEQRRKGREEHPFTRHDTDYNGRKRQDSDYDFNVRKRQEQDEIDRLLDKIRKSGYDSLTKEEKQRLFDQRNK